jgi:hypothetical protein
MQTYKIRGPLFKTVLGGFGILAFIHSMRVAERG